MTKEEALKALNDVWYINQSSKDAKDRLEALLNSHFDLMEKVKRVVEEVDPLKDEWNDYQDGHDELSKQCLNGVINSIIKATLDLSSPDIAVVEKDRVIKLQDKIDKMQRVVEAADKLPIGKDYPYELIEALQDLKGEE